MASDATIEIETQSDNSEVIILVHINEKVLALKDSYIANLVYQKNPKLFKTLNSATRISSGILSRKIIYETKQSYNNIGNKIKKSQKFKKKEISSILVEGKDIKRTQRRKFGKFKVSDIPNSEARREHSKNILDIDNPTTADIRDSTLICSSQEISLFRDHGIRTLLFKDNLTAENSLSEVSYSFEYKFETRFEEYVRYILQKLTRSIRNIKQFAQSMKLERAYNYRHQSWNKNVVKKILKDYSNDTGQLDNKRIKKSILGQAAINYNNALSLEPSGLNLPYAKLIESLLPLSTNTPQTMQKIIKHFENLESVLRKSYFGHGRKIRNIYDKPLVSRKKTINRSYTVESREVFDLDSSKLGYNVFSNKQSGLNVYTKAQYGKRTNMEASYGGGSSVRFLTPTGLRMGERLIDVSKDMNEISVDEVRRFRLLKGERVRTHASTKYNNNPIEGDNESSVSNIFNISISPPIPSAMEMKREGEIDPYEDAKNYVGQNSFFITDDPGYLIKRFNQTFAEGKKATFNVLADIMHKTLKPPGAISSITEFTQVGSKYYKATRNPEIVLPTIPPQIRALASQTLSEGDLLKNRNSSPVIRESQMNVFQIKTLTGFKKTEKGFFDLNMPLWEPLSPAHLSKAGPKIAKAYNYEIPEIGWYSDIVPVTIYNNLLYIKG